MLSTGQLIMGFHQLKYDPILDYKRVDEQTVIGVVKSIIEWFDILVENTLLVARLRTCEQHGRDPYLLTPRDKSDLDKDSYEEAKLERSLAQQWKVGSTPEFWKDHCLGFVNYQVPLFDKTGSTGWRAIDLIGLSPQGMPQVWELKKRPPADNPFVMIIQAIAYGVALRHAWNRGEFAAEWLKWLAGVGRPQPNGGPTRDIQLFGIAPTEYWKEFRSRVESRPDLRTTLLALMDRAKRAGFPVELVEFTAKEMDTNPYFCVGPALPV